jgi:hypothetical protein
MRTLYEVLFYACTLGIPLTVVGAIVWAMRGRRYHGRR